MFNQLVTSSDGQGGETTTFTEFKSVWCKVSPSKGTEKQDGGRLNTTQKLTITCRYFPDLVETMQAIYKGEELQIRSISNIEEANEWLEIIVERKAKAQ